jgi:hypothetical protein
MSQQDLEVLEGRINDYKRCDEIFNQSRALDILESLEMIKDKVLPEDKELFDSVAYKMRIIAFPPVPIVPIPPPLNPADITPLLNEIVNLV